MSGKTQPILQEVAQERLKQDAKWGQQNWPMGNGDVYEDLERKAKGSCLLAYTQGRLTWKDILMEEFWEAQAATNNIHLREELIQIAAVAVAQVEALDRRTSNEKTKILSN